MQDDEDDLLGHGALELILDARRGENDAASAVREQSEKARAQADAARLALAVLAEKCCHVIALRLLGEPFDDAGRPLTKDREDTAWEVLSRIGVPKLRATAIAASMAASTHAPAPGSPGWVPPDDRADDEELELTGGEVDERIQAFLDGARLGADVRGKRGDAA